MHDQDTDGVASRELWACSAWLRLWSELIAGLRHDVTGRASALHSLSMVASRGLANSEMVTEELAVEAGKLSDLAALLDAFPAAGGRRGFGVSISDVVARLPEVLRMTTPFRDAEVSLDIPDSLPAVAVAPGPTGAAVLLMLAQALEDSVADKCVVAAVSNTAGVQLSVAPLEARAGTEERNWLDDDAVAGIDAMIAAEGGSFSAGGSNTAHVLTLPTL